MKDINVIALLGGWVAKNQNGVWRSSNFEEINNAAPGSILRVLAASYLQKIDSEAVIVALGGKGQLSNVPDAPPMAEVLKRELVEFGVPEEKILTEEKSGNTYQQLAELKKMIDKISPKEIKIVTNKYHLPRVRMMLYYDPILDNMRTRFNIKILSAEKIVFKYDISWKEVVERAYKHPQMLKIIKKEKEGTEQVQKGSYKFL